MNKTYTAVVTREDRQWLGDVPAVVGAHTYSRTLAGLVRGLRETIILMEDLPDDAEVGIDLAFEVNDGDLGEAVKVGRERAAIQAKERTLVEQTARCAARLAGDIGVRDIAIVLGITPGRVSQLTK